MVVLVPKLSVALKRRVELRNCVDGGENEGIARGCGYVIFRSGVMYKKVVGHLSLR